MSALPKWAQAPEARALIAAIIEQRPECSAPKSDWGNRVLTFHGEYPEKLRRYHLRHFDREITLAEADALELNVRPDALIARLLAEVDATPTETLADGRARIAA